MHFPFNIQLISAPSILGLVPSGVQFLADALLGCGLAQKLKSNLPVIEAPVLNQYYDEIRDAKTKCLNTYLIKQFSISLSKIISKTTLRGQFPVVLGGDCSILLGIMDGINTDGRNGLIYLDAHADFYSPEKSLTGQVADMDLAILTGRGPATLVKLREKTPAVKEENVIHIGQRDLEETQRYGSEDIRRTRIKCIDLTLLKQKGTDWVNKEIKQYMESLNAGSFWIHFDTDVLDDKINPAVDYRLAGGLSFLETEDLINNLLCTGLITGLSVTIFNPMLDKDKAIANQITESLGRAFDMTNQKNLTVGSL